MAPQTEASDLAVDELKRRARRRLVGAVVLALAAAVILPLLLESDPKPLGGDVSIQIPPIDNSKFVTPLSPEKVPAPAPASDQNADAKAAAPTGDAAPIAAPPKRGPAEAEQHVLGQTTSRWANAHTAVEAKPLQAGDPQPPGDAKEVVSTSPQPVTEINSGVAADAKPAVVAIAPSPPTPPPALPKAAASGGFQVQVAAFADARLAVDLAKKIKAAGFAVRTEEVPTKQGAVQRVRVGPFSTRAAADAATTRLKALGYGNAQVVAAK